METGGIKLNFLEGDADIEEGCEIMGFLGILIQAIMGILSFTALLVKRYFENPKRSWLVWALDTSKQIFSAALAHCMNVFLAMMLSGSHQSDNCEWYFINTAIDITIGILLSYLILHVIELAAGYMEWHVLNTGVYVKENR